MAHGFQKFISEVFVNGKFPKILPFENFPLYGISVWSPSNAENSKSKCASIGL